MIQTHSVCCAHRFGLRGFYERDEKPINLTSEMVDGVHLKGGTVLVSCSVIISAS